MQSFKFPAGTHSRGGEISLVSRHHVFFKEPTIRVHAAQGAHTRLIPL